MTYPEELQAANGISRRYFFSAVTCIIDGLVNRGHISAVVSLDEAGLEGFFNFVCRAMYRLFANISNS
jgi:hypothetical protein